MKVLALDTETELITPRCKAPRLVCISWAEEGQPGHVFKWNGDGLTKPWEPHHGRLWVAERLNDKNELIVGQNVAFDMAVLATQWPELLPKIFQAYADDRITDTIIRQKLIDIAQGYLGAEQFAIAKAGYKLGQVAASKLGKQLDKDTWRLRYGELRDVPFAEWPEGAKEYPIQDAISTLEMWRKQEENAIYLEDQYRQSRHAFWLHLMSCWGIATDLDRVQELEASITEELEDVRQKLLAAGLLRPKSKKPDAQLARDTKAAKARMVEAVGGEENCKATEKGAICLDDEACRASGDKLLVAYADYTHLAGMLSKDVEALRQGEIHARINSLLDTGRVSAGGNVENGGYNVTNPARGGWVRPCFVPRGTRIHNGKLECKWLFVDSDYDGLELRTMSQACLELVGHSTMADVLNAGEDPHIMLAARLLGRAPVVEVRPDGTVFKNEDYVHTKAQIKAGDKRAKEARQFAKIGNFGRAGGMGDQTMVDYAKSNGIEITLEQSHEIGQAWIETWPEFRAYFARAADMTADGEDAQAEQLFSRRFRGGLYFSQLCNTYFQGLGADAAKAAGWAISRACYDETQGSILFGCRIVNFVHDQFLVEVPADELAHDRAQEVGRLMVQEANKWLPDVPATTTPCLATCWSKDAEAVYDERGRLIPWSPQGALFVGLFKWFGKLAAQAPAMKEAA